MMKNSYSLKAGIAVLTLLVSQLAFAGQAGTVTFKTGDVSITRADKTVIKAEKNVALNAGDTIETKDGRLQLSLIDGGKVSLQPNTIYRINKYEFSGKEDGTEYGFTELVKGGLRTVSGLIGHKNRDRYQLKTAVATIGIRGTEFTVNFNNNQLIMTTNHGSVDVCNQGGCLNATTGQSIGVAGPGAKPKPSDIAATASAPAPAAEETKVASKDSEESKSDTKVNSDTKSSPTKDAKSDSTATDTTAVADTKPTNTTTEKKTNTTGPALDTKAALNPVSSSAPVFAATGPTTDTGIPKIIMSSMKNGPGTIVTLAATDNGEYNQIDNVDLEFDGAVLKKAQSVSINITPNKFASFNADGIVAWGQVIDGAYDNARNNKTILLDYVAGATPSIGSLARLTGSYSVFASTAPFLVSGGSASTVGAANKTTGRLDFDFSKSTFTYGLSVLAANNTFTLGGGGSLNPRDPNFYGNNAQSSIVSTACAVAACSGALQGNRLIQGSFLGANGERVGLQYGFDVPGLNGAIYGGAVLK